MAGNKANFFSVIFFPAYFSLFTRYYCILYYNIFQNDISAGLGKTAVTMENFSLIAGSKNFEFCMRIKSGVNNAKTLFTDLNGMTITKKEYYDKLHIQGNVYPVVTSAYIQDNLHRNGINMTCHD